jgi:hypothetical protein
LSTLSSYLSVSQNIARYQKMTAADPVVKNASDYYRTNIGRVKSIGEFVGNYRLLSYALAAYGLGDHVADKALVARVLQGGVSSSKSLANTLSDPRWKIFAKAFDFVGKGASSVSSDAAVKATASAYVENELEINQGVGNVAVQLALYFKRVAPTISSSYSVLGDKNLLQVAQTVLKLPALATGDLDKQAKVLDRMMPIKDLKDPDKLEKLIERFTAMYDLTYGPGSSATSGLTAVGYGKTSGTAAAGILQDVITANGQMLASVMSSNAPKTLFSDQMMFQLQRLTIGGL